MLFFLLQCDKNSELQRKVYLMWQMLRFSSSCSNSACFLELIYKDCHQLAKVFIMEVQLFVLVHCIQGNCFAVFLINSTCLLQLYQFCCWSGVWKLESCRFELSTSKLIRISNFVWITSGNVLPYFVMRGSFLCGIFKLH